MTEQREHAAEEKQVFTGGATRSKANYRYDLVPPEGERRLAERYWLGAEKHGDNNWKNGDYTFIVGCVNHLQAHVGKLKRDGNQFDDNTGAILWAGAALAWFEENKPEEWKKAMAYLRGIDG